MVVELIYESIYYVIIVIKVMSSHLIYLAIGIRANSFTFKAVIYLFIYFVFWLLVNRFWLLLSLVEMPVFFLKKKLAFWLKSFSY